MRERLEKGTLIWFDPDENGKYKSCLEITGYLAEGGSSIVYFCFLDGIRWTLKEMFPSDEGVEREASGNIKKKGISEKIPDLLLLETKTMIDIQNDTENSVMELPFTIGMLKDPAIQRPGAPGPVPCSQQFSLEQFIKGKTLDKVCPKTLKEKLLLARSICSTLEGYHSAGYILCDLKPQNIIVTDMGHVYFLDIATALKTDKDGKAYTNGMLLPSTSGYTAPELFDGDTKFLTRSYDIYSVGALLQDILIPEKISKIRVDQFLHLTHFASVYSASGLEHLGAFFPKSIERENDTDPAIADALSRIMKKCMADDPERRYQSAGQLQKAVEDVIKILECRPETSADCGYDLVWHACYDRWKESCALYLNGQIDSLTDRRIPRERPAYWNIAPLFVSDEEEGTFILEKGLDRLEKMYPIYFYGESGSGKSMAMAGIISKALEKGPAFYLDFSDLPEGESLEAWLFRAMFNDLSDPAEAFQILKHGSRPMLVILDNIQKVPADEQESIYTQIKNMAGDAVCLIAIGHREKPELLSSFNAVKCEGLIEEDDPFMRLPFFYQKNRELSFGPGEENGFKKVYIRTENREKIEYDFLDMFYKQKAKEYPEALRLAELSAATLASKNCLTTKDMQELAVRSGMLEVDTLYLEDLLCSKYDVFQKGFFGPSREEGFRFSHDRLQEFFALRNIVTQVMQAIYLRDPSVLSDMIVSFPKYIYGLLWNILGKEEMEKLRKLLEEHPDSGDTAGAFCSCIAECMFVKPADYYSENDLVSWAETGHLLGQAECLQILATIALRRPPESKDHDEGIDLCRKGMELGQRWAFGYMGFMALKEMFALDGFEAYIDYNDHLRLKLGHTSKDRYMTLWRLHGENLPALGERVCDEISVSSGLDWILKDTAFKSSIDRWRYSMFPQREYALEILSFFA